jgi:type IV secretory pathway VirB6-like protein
VFQSLKKYIIILLSVLLLVFFVCEKAKAAMVGGCTDDPGDGSIMVTAKPATIFSNGSDDLWQTQLSDWQETPYYTNGEDIIINIAIRNSGYINAHGDNDNKLKYPCNICSKIVKYNTNGSIAYQTPNCICGPKIYVPPIPQVQSFRYWPGSKEIFKPIETIKPECEIILGYPEKAHYGIIDNNQRIACRKGSSNEIIEISSNHVNIVSPLFKTDINSQEYTCIPMEWALNLGTNHPNFIASNSKITTFLNQNYIDKGKYYSRATHLLTTDFKKIPDENGQSGYEIVHFPVNYYEKELSTTETDQAKITLLKDVNYHHTNSCNASNGFSLYLGLFPENSDMPGYNGKIYAYHLYSFNQICRIYRNGICENAVTQFKLSKSNLDSILPSSFLDNNNNPISIPHGYKIKFKIYDNFYTSNEVRDLYNVTITSGIETQNYAKPNQDEGLFTNVKSKIDAILQGAQSYNFNISNINYASLFISPVYAADIIEEATIENAKKNGLIRVTYENFIVKNITIIRYTLILFLMFYAISYLMGLSEINQKELILRLFKIAIVLAFLDPALIDLTTKTKISLDPSKTIQKQYSFQTTATLGFLFYQKYIINTAIGGLNDLIAIITNFCTALNLDSASAMQTEVSLSNNVNFAYFDKILEKIFSIKTVGAIVSAIFTKWLIGAVLLVVFLYFLVKTIFKLLVTYILNWLQIILALSLGPIFFLFLLFSKTKGFFTKWIAFTFARALDIVILVALTFPFIGIIYVDLLAIIGEESCLRAIGPSFLRLEVWIQNDNPNSDLNNFFSYIFALAKDIALVYMINLIASYAPEISGKIINIADNQNSAGNSKAASNIAAQTTAQALSTIASGIKFANSSYVGGMAKSYVKQGALGLSNFVGATRVATFAKDTALNLGNQLYEGLTLRNAAQILLGKETAEAIFGKKNTTNTGRDGGGSDGGSGGSDGGSGGSDGGSGVPGGAFASSRTSTAGSTPADGSGGSDGGSGVPGGAFASSRTSTAGSAPADGSGVPGGAFASSRTSAAGGAPAGSVPAGGVPGGAPAGSGVPGGAPADGSGVPGGGFAGGAPAGGGTPAGGAPAGVGVGAAGKFAPVNDDAEITQGSITTILRDLEQSMPKTGQPQTLGPALATQMQRALTQLEKKIDKLQKMQSDTEILPNSDQPSTESLIKERSITPQEMLTYIENRLDDLKSKTKIEKYQTALQDTRNKITKQSQSQQDVEAVPNVPRTMKPAPMHQAAPVQTTPVQTTPVQTTTPTPGQPISKSSPDKAETYSALPANDNYSQLQAKFQPFYNSELQELQKQLTLDNALDLFIKANDAKLKKLQMQFQTDQNTDIEKELQQVFEKFKADFTTINKSASQQTSRESISTTEIVAKIVANDNKSPTTSDAIKQQNFSKIATKLQKANVLPELQEQLRNQDKTKKQEALVSLLADRDRTKESANLKKILEEIKNETREQERINHLKEMFSQAERVKAFTQYYNPEPDTSAISQVELEHLKNDKKFNFNEEQINAIKQYQYQNPEKVAIDTLNTPETLTALKPEEIDKVSNFLLQQTEVTEMMLAKLNNLEEEPAEHKAITPEELENQKRSLDIVLKLMGVKYKSDRNKAIDFLLAINTADSITDLQGHFDQIYILLEKPLQTIHKKDKILAMILTSANEDIKKQLETSPADQENRKYQLKLTLEKNEKTLAKVNAREKSFKSLFGRIKKAIEKS